MSINQQEAKVVLPKLVHNDHGFPVPTGTSPKLPSLNVPVVKNDISCREEMLLENKKTDFLKFDNVNFEVGLRVLSIRKNFKVGQFKTSDINEIRTSSGELVWMNEEDRQELRIVNMPKKIWSKFGSFVILFKKPVDSDYKLSRIPRYV